MVPRCLLSAIIATLVLYAHAGDAAARATGGANKGEKNTVMNHSQKKALEVISLSDGEILDMDEGKVAQLSLKLAAAFEEDPFAAPPTQVPRMPDLFLALAAPKVVNLEQREDFSILLAARRTGLRQWEVDKDQNARLLVFNLDTGEMKSQRLFVRPKRMLTPEPSRSGPKPEGVAAAASMIGVESRVELRPLLGLDWRPARLALTVVEYDLISNTVFVELKGGGEREAAKSQRASAFLSGVQAVPASPKLQENGMSLAVPPNAGGQKPVIVHGAVRLPADQTVTVADSSDRGKFLLKLSMVLVKLDQENAVQIELVVPATLRGGAGAGQTVEAYFSMDIHAALPGLQLNGTNQIYLNAGGQVAGPYSIGM